MKKTSVAIAIAIAVGAGSASAAQIYPPTLGPVVSTQGNFTMLTPNGLMQGGSNDVKFSWDGSLFTDSGDYNGPGSTTANMWASSDEPFSGATWSAHDIQIFAPGTYSFDTSLGGGNGESGILTATAGANQMLAHMLFDWGPNLNIDMVLIMEQGGVFGNGYNYLQSGPQCRGTTFAAPTDPIACLFDGKDNGIQNTPGTVLDGTLPTVGQVWHLVSVDGDGDNIPGIQMAPGGPFEYFQGNFNGMVAPAAIPVPAAVWLFGSGLLGLVGVARRKKS